MNQTAIKSKITRLKNNAKTQPMTLAEKLEIGKQIAMLRTLLKNERLSTYDR